MLVEQVRARCERLLADVDLPAPFSMNELCRRLGVRRGKPIQLLPTSSGEPAPASGVWIELNDRDVILYDGSTTAFHQQLIVAHELGHMLCDHYPGSVMSEEVSSLLLPSLDPALVQRILSRTDYSSREEREAETFATLLLQRAGQQPPQGRAGQGPRTTALLTQLGSTFEE